MGIDKVKHFAVGAIIAVVTTFLVYHGMHLLGIYYGDDWSKIAVAMSQLAIVSLAATLKELNDSKFEWWDWLATVIPSLGMFIIILLYF